MYSYLLHHGTGRMKIWQNDLWNWTALNWQQPSLAAATRISTCWKRNSASRRSAAARCCALPVSRRMWTPRPRRGRHGHPDGKPHPAGGADRALLHQPGPRGRGKAPAGADRRFRRSHGQGSSHPPQDAGPKGISRRHPQKCHHVRRRACRHRQDVSGCGNGGQGVQV